MKILMQTEDIIELNITLDEHTADFEGHFPNAPVLPGVTQLQWVLEQVQEYWYPDAWVSSVPRLKFQKVAVPSMTLTLKIKKRANKKVEFQYGSDEDVVSSGVIQLEGI